MSKMPQRCANREGELSTGGLLPLESLNGGNAARDSEEGATDLLSQNEKPNMNDLCCALCVCVYVCPC